MKVLSLVIQGPSGTKYFSEEKMLRRLAKTRELFPEAEIIFSTWKVTSEENENKLLSTLNSMKIKLVQSVDPGPVTITDGNVHYTTNVNRLIVSTCAGLAEVTRPLTVKLRSDCYLSATTVFSLLQRHINTEDGFVRNDAYKVFQQRVISCSWIARDARGSLPYLFHPSDIFLAGRTEDIRLYFSAPLATDTLFSPAFSKGLWTAWRYVPEQWLWVNAIKQKKFATVFDGNFQSSPELIEKSEQFFLANFIPLSAGQLALHWPKYWMKYPGRGLFSLYSYRRWLRLYERSCGKSRFHLLDVVESLFTRLWRVGYIFRTWLLRINWLRRFALYNLSLRK